jgi:hypothetical protein
LWSIRRLEIDGAKITARYDEIAVALHNTQPNEEKGAPAEADSRTSQ